MNFTSFVFVKNAQEQQIMLRLKTSACAFVALETNSNLKCSNINFLFSSFTTILLFLYIFIIIEEKVVVTILN